MRRWWQTRSLRTSLTLWYVAAMVIVLGLYAAVVFLFVSRNLSEALDDRLRGDFQWAARMAEEQPDGSLTWFQGSTADDDPPWLQVWAPNGTLLFRTELAAANPVSTSRGSGRPSRRPRRRGAGRRDDVPAAERVLENRRRAGRHSGGALGSPDEAGAARAAPDADSRPAAGGRGRRVRRLYAGPPRAGADRAHDGARPDHHRRPPERSPAGRQPRRRDRTAGVRVQRDAGTPRGVVRPDAAVHGRRVARAANAAHRDPQRRRSRPPRTARRGALSRDHRQHARGGGSAVGLRRSAAGAVARGKQSREAAGRTNGPRRAGG